MREIEKLMLPLGRAWGGVITVEGVVALKWKELAIREGLSPYRRFLSFQ